MVAPEDVPRSFGRDSFLWTRFGLRLAWNMGGGGFCVVGEVGDAPRKTSKNKVTGSVEVCLVRVPELF